MELKDAIEFALGIVVAAIFTIVLKQFVELTTAETIIVGALVWIIILVFGDRLDSY